MKPRCITGLAGLLAALAACSSPAPADADGDQAAGEAADTSEHTDFEGAVLLAATDGAAVAGGAAAQAAASAAQASAVYLPAGCVHTSVNGAIANYLFADCTGPRGLVHLSGAMRLTYGTMAGTLTAHADSVGLRVNGAVLNLDADVTYTSAGNGFSLAVATHSGGIGPRGNRLTRMGSYTVAWDEAAACRTLNGDWETVVGARESATMVAGLRRCGAHCPQPGGMVAYANDAVGASVALMFPGGADALWSTSNHESGIVALTCTD